MESKSFLTMLRPVMASVIITSNAMAASPNKRLGFHLSKPKAGIERNYNRTKGLQAARDRSARIYQQYRPMEIRDKDDEGI